MTGLVVHQKKKKVSRHDKATNHVRVICGVRRLCCREDCPLSQ
jgi:hypothetical protein